MPTALPAFTPLEDSLWLTPYARALDSRRPHPILADTMAGQIVHEADYDFGQLHIDTNLILNVALRAKKLDQVASEFLARHPDAVGLDLGAGLDTRVFRLAPPSTADRAVRPEWPLHHPASRPREPRHEHTSATASPLPHPHPRPPRPGLADLVRQLTIAHADDGTTELADQAALFGLLARLRDLGATLLLVERLTFDHRDPREFPDRPSAGILMIAARSSLPSCSPPATTRGATLRRPCRRGSEGSAGGGRGPEHGLPGWAVGPLDQDGRANTSDEPVDDRLPGTAEKADPAILSELLQAA
ncbi:MAG TPA: class I SAM-dependent methyltransferase [Streptosporangiaceae bacterium]|nr:class I SAM-dependent methyltransferase [Streptosporangiaceae bacterium]